jgi:hypothetical protein
MRRENIARKKNFLMMVMFLRCHRQCLLHGDGRGYLCVHLKRDPVTLAPYNPANPTSDPPLIRDNPIQIFGLAGDKE